MTEKSSRFQWLTSWGTFITAIAAAIGLAVTALASFSAWQTVRNQEDKDQRTQASLVTVWQDEREEGGGLLHVTNRSLDPVAQWRLVLYSYPDTSRDGMRAYSSSMPPCTELILDPTKLPNRKTDKPDVLTLTYVDSSGIWWKRGSWGRLEQTNTISEGEPDEELSFDEIEALGGKIRTPEQCGNK